MPSIPVVMFNVSPEARTGGEIYNLSILYRLRALGVDVLNISLPPDNPLLPLPIRLLFANFTILRKILRLKVTHCILFEDCDTMMRFALCNWWARKRGIKIVMFMQFNFEEDHRLMKRPFWRRVARFILVLLFRQANLVLANSQHSACDAIYLGCVPDKIKVIYCGFDTPVEGDDRCRMQEGSDRGFRLLVVANVIERKGLHYLIQAMTALSDFPFKVDVVGSTQREPDYFRGLVSLICENRLADKVTFHGHIADRKKLWEFYRKASVFVLPSLHETFGIVLLEAMSFGLPIVSTTAGAIPELIKHGVNGLLVPPREPEALASALVQMATSNELRHRLAQAGYEFVALRKELYSWEAVGLRVFQAMRPLLEQEPT